MPDFAFLKPPTPPLFPSTIDTEQGPGYVLEDCSEGGWLYRAVLVGGTMPGWAPPAGAPEIQLPAGQGTMLPRVRGPDYMSVEFRRLSAEHEGCLAFAYHLKWGAKFVGTVATGPHGEMELRSPRGEAFKPPDRRMELRLLKPANDEPARLRRANRFDKLHLHGNEVHCWRATDASSREITVFVAGDEPRQSLVAASVPGSKPVFKEILATDPGPSVPELPVGTRGYLYTLPLPDSPAAVPAETKHSKPVLQTELPDAG